MKKLMLLALPLAAVSAPAFAEVPAGFRLEAMAGYDQMKADTDEVVGDTSENEKFGGVFYGGGVGFDFAMGPGFAVGADAEFTLATTDIEIAEGEISLGRDLYVGGRITGSISETFNVYAKAGYTNLRVRLNADEGVTADEDDFEVAGNLDGIRAALGVQIQGDERTYYGFEARYSNYEAGVTRRQAMAFVGVRF